VRNRLEKYLCNIIAMDMMQDLLSEIRERNLFSICNVLKYLH
jgi:hypothetical protein